MPFLFPRSDADELCLLNAADLSAAYRSRKLSPVEVTKAALARAEAVNAKFNAFSFIDHDGALKNAAAAECRWRNNAELSAIDGIPTTIKDVILTKDWSVRFGSTTTSAKPCDVDAPVVTKLRAAGAVFTAQTTTPEFGWKALTDSHLCGITRNPWNEALTPGGSSGGAGVAAATAAGTFHLGSDGGGSIRVPAAFTGTVGLKPTFGRVAAYPASTFGTVTHIGPMTNCVSDAMTMLEVIAGRDLRDWMQGAGSLAPLDYRHLGLAGKKIAYWAKPVCGTIDIEIDKAVKVLINRLEAEGVIIDEVFLPYADDLPEIFYKHWYTGAATRLSVIAQEQHEAIDQGFLEIARRGAEYSVVDLVRAQVQRADYGAVMDELLTKYDFILSPATAILPFEAGYEVPPGSDYKQWIEWAGFSFPINLSQQPACVIPCAVSETKLPIGLQIIGARGNDAQVLSMASCLERFIG